MPSLQLLQLTDHGRNLVASRRKLLLLGTSILVAGGAAAYAQLRFRRNKPYSLAPYNGFKDEEENQELVVKNSNSIKKSNTKKGGLKSLEVLARILLSRMGQTGARDLLGLVLVAVF